MSSFVQVYVNHMHIPEPENDRGRGSSENMLDLSMSMKLKENLSPDSMLSLGPASDGAFFKAILCVREDDSSGAYKYIRLAREQVVYLDVATTIQGITLDLDMGVNRFGMS